MDQSIILTGDSLLFSSNTSTGFMLKMFTSSLWNHSGIAVRINDDGEIVLDSGGKLYVLEINTWERTDAITGKKVLGVGYSDFEWVKKRYNIIVVRAMKEIYRKDKIINRIDKFVSLYRGYEFTTDIEPFLSVWLGVELMEDSGREKSMFCSEFMSYFYMYILRMNSVEEVMGPTILLPRLCAPKHFSYEFTPLSPVFVPHDKIVYIEYCDIGPCLVPILIITFFVLAIVWMTIPRK